MSPRYLRNRPERRDDVAAAIVSGAVAVGVGVVVFYFARLLLAREPLPEVPVAAGADSRASGDS